METTVLRKRIRDAVVLLEDYRGFGPMVGEGVDALNRLEACVAEPTPERVARGQGSPGEP